MKWLIDLPARLGRVTASGRYIPQIDGLRFLAIVPVLFFHAGQRGERIYGDMSATEMVVASYLPQGQLGVSLFFFISGYIIATPFFTRQSLSLRRFYLRRLFRLEPPYIIAMLACFLILSLGVSVGEAPNFHASDSPLWQSLLASLTYTHGLIFGEHPRLNPPAWSLEMEIQFYLLAPFLIAGYLKLRDRKLRMGIGSMVCVSSLVIGTYIEHALIYQHPLRHSLVAQLYPFLLGIVVCDYSSAAQPFSRPAASVFDIWLAVGIVGLLFSGAVETHLGLGLSILNSFFRACCILMIFFGAARGCWGRQILGAPWIALIGGACYSIYLVHVPVMQAGMLVLGRVVPPQSLMGAWTIAWLTLVPAGILAGLIFYALIERPCMAADWPRRLWARARRSNHSRVDQPTVT